MLSQRVPNSAKGIGVVITKGPIASRIQLFSGYRQEGFGLVLQLGFLDTGMCGLAPICASTKCIQKEVI